MIYLLTEPRTCDRLWCWLTDWFISVTHMEINEKQFRAFSNEAGKCNYFQLQIEVCALTEHKILSYQCRKCHYGDKTIVKSCAHKGICYILTRCHLYIESGLRCKWIRNPLFWLMLTRRNCTAKKAIVQVSAFFPAFLMKCWYDILDWTCIYFSL